MSCQTLLICHHDQLLFFPSLLGQRFKNLLYNNNRAVDKALQLAALQLQDTLCLELKLEIQTFLKALWWKNNMTLWERISQQILYSKSHPYWVGPKSCKPTDYVGDQGFSITINYPSGNCASLPSLWMLSKRRQITKERQFFFKNYISIYLL